MRDAMRELNGQRGSDDVMLKIGMHKGPCLAVNLNDRQDFFGQTVNIAARVQALATSDGILASEQVVRNPEAARLLAARKVRAQSRLQSLRRHRRADAALRARLMRARRADNEEDRP